MASTAPFCCTVLLHKSASSMPGTYTLVSFGVLWVIMGFMHLPSASAGLAGHAIYRALATLPCNFPPLGTLAICSVAAVIIYSTVKAGARNVRHRPPQCCR